MDKDLLERLPYPIARPLHEARQDPAPSSRFRGSIRAFYATLRYVTTLSLCDYVFRLRDRILNGELDIGGRDKTLQTIEETLASPTFARMSLGHWWQLERNILALLPTPSGYFVPELGTALIAKERGAFPKDLGLQKSDNLGGAVVDRLINLRNEYVHPDIQPPDDWLVSINSTVDALLGILVHRIAFLADYRLLLISHRGEAVLAHGWTVDSFSPVRLGDGDREEIGGTPFVLKRSDGSLLPLAPMVWYGRPLYQTSEELRDLLLFDASTKKDIKYLLANHLAYVRDAEAFRATLRIPEIQRTPGKEAERQDSGGQDQDQTAFSLLRARAETQARRIIDVHVANKKYFAALYVARKSIEGVCEGWLQDEEHGALVVVGDSGCGKTNLVCRLTNRWMSRGHAVLHYYGRNWNGKPFRTVLAEDLGVDAPDLDGALDAMAAQAGDKRFVVIVDAVNEYEHPEELLHALVEWIEKDIEKRRKFLKVLVTCRLLQWREMEPAFHPGRSFYREAFPGEEARPYVLLGAFDRDELGQAYAGHMTKYGGVAAEDLLPIEALPADLAALLRTPMFLRFYALGGQLAESERANPPRTAGELLLRYIPKIPDRHRHLLNLVVEEMWKARRDALSWDRIKAHEGLQAYVMEDPVEDTCTIRFCPVHLPDEIRALSFDEIPPARREELKDPEGKCPACERSVTASKDYPVVSSYSYLKEEGILTEYEDAEEQPVLRFTYDRFFEALMGLRIRRELTCADPVRRVRELASFAGDRLAFWDAVVSAVVWLLRDTEAGKAEPSRFRQALWSLAVSPVEDCIRLAASIAVAWHGIDPGPAEAFVGDLHRIGLARLCGKRLKKGISEDVEGLLEPPVAGDLPAELRTVLRVLESNILRENLVGWAFETGSLTRAKNYTASLFGILRAHALQEIGEGRSQGLVDILSRLDKRLSGRFAIALRHRSLAPVFDLWARSVLAAAGREDQRAILTAFGASLAVRFPLIRAGGSRWRRWIRRFLVKPVVRLVLRVVREPYREHFKTMERPRDAGEGWKPPTLEQTVSLNDAAAKMFEGFCGLVERIDNLPPLREEIDWILKLRYGYAYDETFSWRDGVAGGLLSVFFVRQGESIPSALESIRACPGMERWLYCLNSVKYAALLGDRSCGSAALEACREAVRRLRNNHRGRFLFPREPGGSFTHVFAPWFLFEVNLHGRATTFEEFVLAELHSEHPDWATVSVAFFDLLYIGSISPGAVCMTLERLVDLRNGVIRYGDRDNPGRIPLADMDTEEAKGVIGLVDRNGVSPDEVRPAERIAAARCLETIGSMGILAPRVLDAMLKRNHAPAGLVNILDSFRSPDRIREYREGRAIQSFVMHSLCETPLVRDTLCRLIRHFVAFSRERGFRTLSGKDIALLAADSLELVLDALAPHMRQGVERWRTLRSAGSGL